MGIARVDYRSIGNLHVHVFLTYYETEIITTSKDFTMCSTGTCRCYKKVCLAFALAHISCSKNLVYPAHSDF